MLIKYNKRERTRNRKATEIDWDLDHHWILSIYKQGQAKHKTIGQVLLFLYIIANMKIFKNLKKINVLAKKNSTSNLLKLGNKKYVMIIFLTNQRLIISLKSLKIIS